MPVNNHFHQSHFSCVLLDGAFCRCDKGIFIILHFYNTFNNIINTANETPRQTLRNYVEYLTIYLHMRQTLPSPCEFVYDIGTHSATVNQHPTSICTSHNSTAHLGSIFRDNSLHWYRFYLPITSQNHYEYVDHNANTGQNYTSFRSVRQYLSVLAVLLQPPLFLWLYRQPRGLSAEFSLRQGQRHTARKCSTILPITHRFTSEHEC